MKHIFLNKTIFNSKITYSSLLTHLLILAMFSLLLFSIGMPSNHDKNPLNLISQNLSKASLSKSINKGTLAFCESGTLPFPVQIETKKEVFTECRKSKLLKKPANFNIELKKIDYLQSKNEVQLLFSPEEGFVYTVYLEEFDDINIKNKNKKVTILGTYLHKNIENNKQKILSSGDIEVTNIEESKEIQLKVFFESILNNSGKIFLISYPEKMNLLSKIYKKIKLTKKPLFLTEVSYFNNTSSKEELVTRYRKRSQNINLEQRNISSNFKVNTESSSLAATNNKIKCFIEKYNNYCSSKPAEDDFNKWDIIKVNSNKECSDYANFRYKECKQKHRPIRYSTINSNTFEQIIDQEPKTNHKGSSCHIIKPKNCPGQNINSNKSINYFMNSYKYNSNEVKNYKNCFTKAQSIASKCQLSENTLISISYSNKNDSTLNKSKTLSSRNLLKIGLQEELIEEENKNKTLKSLLNINLDKLKIIYMNPELKTEAEYISKIIQKSTNKLVPTSYSLDYKINSISLAFKNLKSTEQDGRFLYHSDINKKQISLRAEDVNGIKNAVSYLLLESLGVRHVLPNYSNKNIDLVGTYIPSIKKEQISFPIENMTQHIPKFSMRQISGKYFNPFSNIDNNFILEWAQRIGFYGHSIAFHHNMKNIFKPNQRLNPENSGYNPKLFPTHKGKLYPLLQNDGTRNENYFQPNIIKDSKLDQTKKVAVDYINDVFNNKKWGHINSLVSNPNSISLGINDCNYWDDKLFKEYPLKNTQNYNHFSDIYYEWVNKIATDIKPFHPTKKLGVLCYKNVLDAPSFKLDSSVIPFLPFDRIRWYNDEYKQKDIDRTLKWLEKTDNLAWYDYLHARGDDKYRKYLIPKFYPSALKESIKWASDHGIKRYYAESWPGRILTTAPNFYLLSKILWNPEIDHKQEFNDWCNASVGKEGAIYLKKYFEFWENYWKNIQSQSEFFTNENYDRDYLFYHSNRYLHDLNKADINYIDDLIENLNISTRNSETQFRERAKFYISNWTHTIRKDVNDFVQKYNTDNLNQLGFKLISNNNFEDGLQPNGFYIHNRKVEDTGHIAEFKTVKKSNYISGNYSLKASMRQVKPGNKLNFPQKPKSAFYKFINNLKPSNNYVLKFKIKTEDMSGREQKLFARLQYFKKDKQEVARQFQKRIDASNNSTIAITEIIDFTTPSRTKNKFDSIRLAFILEGAGDYTIHIDNLELWEKK